VGISHIGSGKLKILIQRSGTPVFSKNERPLVGHMLGIRLACSIICTESPERLVLSETCKDLRAETPALGRLCGPVKERERRKRRKRRRSSSTMRRMSTPRRFASHADSLAA
jgi:hypothetical protein